MADRYCYSGGSNTSPYDTWAKAATTLATAATGQTAGDTIWVASDHAETAGSAKSITVTGTIAAPQRIISVNRAGSVPPVAADILAGATITTTGAFAITLTGFFYMYGLTFNVGTGASTANFIAVNGGGNRQVLEACAINLVTTSASSRISFSQSSAFTDFVDTTFSFGSVGQGFLNNGQFNWRNKPGSTGITGATIPTFLLINNAPGTTFPAKISGVDLSAFGSGKSISDATGFLLQIINCKLDASVTVAAAPAQNANNGVDLIGCHSTTNVARNERYRYAGILTTETTIIRTAGASDGTTPYSWKVVTTANAKPAVQFETFEGAVWNTATGSSKTLTIHCVTDNVTLTDAEIWVEVEYLGSSATPVASLITDAPATILTAGANQASDSGEAWTTTGLTTPLKQKLEVTFTPQMIGPIRWRVKVAKASTTVYIDPNVDIA